MREYIFDFWATRFSGLNHTDNGRQESIKVVASNFENAIEMLRKKLHDFQGSNSFEKFTVTTPNGSFAVLTEPSPTFDIYGLINHTSFTFAEQLV